MQQCPAALAARGFAALSFDFTGFGESGGEPRDVEDPARKVADIHAAVTHLASVEEIDETRLSALGVCASAGYTVVNAVADSRIRALALVAPWLHDADLVEDLYGGADGIATRIAAANQARRRFETSGIVDYVPAVSSDDSLAAMPFDIDFYQNPDRGGIPQWPQPVCHHGLERMAHLRPDPLRPSPLRARPHRPQRGRRHPHRRSPLRRTAHSTEHRDVDRWGPVRFYDGSSHVARAAEATADHFHAALGNVP